MGQLVSRLLAEHMYVNVSNATPPRHGLNGVSSVARGDP
jgi:hypothetical protein